MKELKAKVKAATPELAAEMVYHDEPFYVACDIAETHDIVSQEELLQRHHLAYRSILEAFGW